jgi:aminomethyltransferase
MGQIETRGPEAAELLQRLLSNDIEAVPVGGAQYSLICREDGGILDDVLTYRLSPQRFLTVTNAANHTKDFAWFLEHATAFDADVIDVARDYAIYVAPRTMLRVIGGRGLLGEIVLVWAT